MSPALRTTISQDDWSDGMVRDVAPQLIPESGAYDIVNALLDEDGSPYRRGGTEYLSGFTPSSTPILDNFNRANEDPVDDGGEWDGSLTEGDLEVASNALLPSNSFAGSAVYDKTVTDGAAYATFTRLGGFNGVWIRTAGEGEPEAFRGYAIQVTKEVSGRWAVSLERADPGASISQIAALTDLTLEDGDGFAVMAIGTSISGWRIRPAGSWVRLLTVTDETYESGRLGVFTGFGGKVDDFGGGPLTAFSTSGLTWLWDGYLLPGHRTFFASNSDFGVLDSSNAMLNLGGPGLTRPKQSAVLQDLLFVGGGAVYGGSRKTATYTTKTVKVVKGSKTVIGKETGFEANADVGMLFQIGAERVYIVASIQSNTELTLRDNYEGSSGENKTYALRPLLEAGGGPYESWDFLTTCANRVVLMSGRTIKYTEVNNPHSFTNSLETTNEHTLPEGVEGLGLATVGQTVLAFHTGGIHVLDGLALDIVDLNGNPQHRLQQLSQGTVLAGATGISGSGQQLVVPCEDGIYLMDGVSQPVRVSRPVETLYRLRMAAGYTVGQAAVFRGHYLLPIITSSAKVRALLVCRLDRQTRSRNQGAYPWSRFTGHGGEAPAFVVSSSLGATEPALLAASGRDAAILDCSAFFEPDESHELDADGTCHDLDVIARDYQTGSGTKNVVRAVKPRYELKGTQAPKVKAFYSDGTQKASGPKWGQVKWGEFLWGSDSDSTFTQIGEAGESNGRDPARFRLNKKLRYARIRFKSFGPSAVCVLRALELTIRPSGATRR